ncbi:MAG: hypothetical protein JWM57_2125 [Phycisphaerales bacterium]|nr:hypothetical protein [Phycisphaerales bacterium]
MTKKSLSLTLILAMLPFVGAASPATPAAPQSATPSSVTSSVASPVRGDYVEARTASVFAGACHYNGERVTEGRSAVLAWRISGGAFNGVDLAGVKLVAAVVCDDNLAEAGAARKSEFVVDASTDQQATAAVAWAKSKVGDQLGQVGTVRREAVTFRHDADEYQMTAAGFATMKVQAMPDAACCSQPHLVWYQPLMPITARRVGYTVSAAYTGHANDAWNRSDENSAIYGNF